MLGLEDVPEPVPEAGRVLVRVEAAAVNHYDLNQRARPPAVPYTPGVDAAGTRVDTGGRVVLSGVPGAYAELVLAPEAKAVPIPESLDAGIAAALGVAYRTAWAALADGRLERGHTLLVQAGSSGTGQAAIDLGRHLGAVVYATASPARHDRLRALGAEPLAYDDPRLESLAADVVFDPVGGGAFRRSLAALGTGGRIVTPGAVAEGTVELDLWALVGKRASVIGTGSARAPADALERLVELAAAGEIRPVVDRELPLADAAEAHRLIEARQVFGKVILRP